MYWKTFDWKNQKVGQKGEVLNKTSYKCGFCKGVVAKRDENLSLSSEQ